MIHHLVSGGEPFQEPEVLQSVDGRLDVTLSVEIAQISFEWFTTYRRTYNGSIPGPTWRIRPGDNVTVTLVRNLMHEVFSCQWNDVTKNEGDLSNG